MSTSPVLGEVSASKVAAVFAGEARAREIAAQLRGRLALAAGQVQVLTPGDRRPGRKLEPESHGIFLTMLRAHAWLGLLGLLAGAVLFGMLWWAGVPFVANSPAIAAVPILLLSGMAGLMLGGLVTLRPDHDPFIVEVLEAIGEGRCAVVVHATERAQYDGAVRLLGEAGGDVVATLAPPGDAPAPTP